MQVKYLIVFIACLSRSTSLANPHERFSNEVVQLVTSWAPLIWLHSEEVFLPSTVEFFLPEMTINDGDENIVLEYPSPQNLPGGPTSSALHMQTRQVLDCPSCVDVPVFYGQDVANGGVPLYTFINEYNDLQNTIDVIYHTFYPYNRGKDVCIGIIGEDPTTCSGVWASFGNHVGDWEHNKMRFINGKPYAIYLSVHSFGAYYLWNEEAQIFEFVDGEPLRNQNGRTFEGKIDWYPDYPPTVQVMKTLDGSLHPVVFSANGSHGLWSSEGQHIYLPLPKLIDECEAGIPWKTWENLILIPWQKYYCDDDLQWINYRGDWGNSPDGCQVEVISGECQLGGGPSGPPKGGQNVPVPLFFR